MEEKNVLKFNEFDLELHYYAFDIDDNLFHMPTVIHLEKKVREKNGQIKWTPIDVSTAEFADIRQELVNDKGEGNYKLLSESSGEIIAFCEFRDNGPRGSNAFIEDMKAAINTADFGPSWPAFKKCLTEGSLFALITARGNAPETYRNAVEYIIDSVLTEPEKFLLYSNCLKFSYIFANQNEFERIPKGTLSETPLIKLYLDSCYYYGVSSDSFALEFGQASASNPEKAKELALEKFIDKCNNFGKKVGAKSVSIGFSDDDPKNVEHVRTYFKEQSILQNELMSHKVKLNLYKTTDRKLVGGERTNFSVIRPTSDVNLSETSNQTPGLENSVLTLTQFGNMTSRLNPQGPLNRQDDFHNKFLQEVNYLAKNSKELSKEIKKAKKPKIRI